MVVTRRFLVLFIQIHCYSNSKNVPIPYLKSLINRMKIGWIRFFKTGVSVEFWFRFFSFSHILLLQLMVSLSALQMLVQTEIQLHAYYGFWTQLNFLYKIMPIHFAGWNEFFETRAGKYKYIPKYIYLCHFQGKLSTRANQNFSWPPLFSSQAGQIFLWGGQTKLLGNAVPPCPLPDLTVPAIQYLKIR